MATPPPTSTHREHKSIEDKDVPLEAEFEEPRTPPSPPETPLIALITKLRKAAELIILITFSPRPGMNRDDLSDGVQRSERAIDKTYHVEAEVRDNIFRFMKAVFDHLCQWLSSTEPHTDRDPDTNLTLDAIFEACVAFLFNASRQGGARDGGIDVECDAGIIQCKRGDSYKGKVNEIVRALVGTSFVAGKPGKLALSFSYPPSPQVTSFIQRAKAKGVDVEILDITKIIALLRTTQSELLDDLSSKDKSETLDYDDEVREDDRYPTRALIDECKRFVKRLETALGFAILDNPTVQLADSLQWLEGKRTDCMVTLSEYHQRLQDDD